MLSFQSRLVLLVFMIALFVQAQSAWRVPLIISCENWQTTLHFGVHTEGSDDFDADLDTLSPPPGFGPMAYFFIGSFPNYLLSDIREPGEWIVWQLQTANCSGKIVKLKWDITEFTAEANENVTLEIPGYCSMTDTDSLEVSGDLVMDIVSSNSSSSIHTRDSYGKGSVEISAFPNPFNSTVSFLIPAIGPGYIHVAIYNVSGRMIHSIYYGYLSEENLMLCWDGTDEHGVDVSTGLYICRAETGKKSYYSKIQLLR